MIYKYDGSGEKCPIPLINLRLLLKKMNKGDVCLIIINDTGSLTDIPKLLNKQGFRYQQKNIDNDLVEISIKI
ncbi:sulfurtransferase TusA family protein [Colwellia echini]|uniref:Sulfurtransferase TusA family protein n=1 Tax=Colwellia echini TaxID=1982103 RepID=A0ABY3MY59_9GAMM|nr:sulfurtransferase TusA family protein [Colwellia echini]TYK66165.1 sulfurtransferase TusA family protein [Colwellia echini]